MEAVSTDRTASSSERAAATIQPSQNNKSNHPLPEDGMISSLAWEILLMGTGIFITIISFQARQEMVAYSNSIQSIANAITQGTPIGGRAIATIDKPVIEAFNKIVTIQPKYCDALLQQSTKYMIAGIFLAIFGILSTARHYTKKVWINNVALFAFPSLLFCGISAWNIKDPRNLSEITHVKEAEVILRQFLKNLS